MPSYTAQTLASICNVELEIIDACLYSQALPNVMIGVETYAITKDALNQFKKDVQEAQELLDGTNNDTSI